MRLHRRRFLGGLAGLVVLGPQLAHAAGPPATPVLTDYTRGATTFAGKEGVFFDPKADPKGNFVQSSKTTRPITGGGMRGMLSLQYIVEAGESYNGHWWKYADHSDWSKHVNDALVLRIAKGEVCTPRFKVEVKSSAKPGGPITVFKSYTWTGGKEHAADLAEKGYSDVVLPLSKFATDPRIVGGKVVVPAFADYPYVSEIVIVFENSEIPKGLRSGELLVNQIRLDPPPASGANGGER